MHAKAIHQKHSLEHQSARPSARRDECALERSSEHANEHSLGRLNESSRGHPEDFSKEESIILDDFHKAVFQLIRICKRVEPHNMEIEWLHNKLALARSVDPLLIIERCKDKLWAYRNEILQRNTDFFVCEQFNQYVKDDENKTLLYTIINIIKRRFLELSNDEQATIWQLINQLLVGVVKYKKLAKLHPLAHQ